MRATIIRPEKRDFDEGISFLRGKEYFKFAILIMQWWLQNYLDSLENDSDWTSIHMWRMSIQLWQKPDSR